MMLIRSRLSALVTWIEATFRYRDGDRLALQTTQAVGCVTIGITLNLADKILRGLLAQSLH